MTGSDSIRLLLVGVPGSEIAAAADMARDEGAQVTFVATWHDAVAALRTAVVDLVMIDVATDVPAFMAARAAERFRVPVLACGVAAPAEAAVAAIRAGARDYVPLPPDRALIAAALACAASRAAPDLVGSDPALVHALGFARAMAASRVPMLIVGEAGTGKETVARTIHAESGRTGAFLVVECAGVAAEIVESELFGHDALAFPGAVARRVGKAEQARGGTLFVRDIDRLPPRAQARLAMMLAEAPDIRLIAATTATLAAAAAAGGFRADLLQRLSTAEIRLPPLRERTGDIAALADHLVRRLAAQHDRAPRPFAPATLALLARHGWAGNVRELEDVVNRALIIAGGAAIMPDDIVLPDGSRLAVAEPGGGEPAMEAFFGRTVEEVERALILTTLERCRGNRTSASGILGISVRTMRNKLKSFVEAGIAVPAV